MINVTIEDYEHDFLRQTRELSLSNLEELADMMFDQSNWHKPRLDDPDLCKHVFFYDGQLEYNTVPGMERYSTHWIHLIENDRGEVVFSDGKLTAGKRHASEAMRRWLEKNRERRLNTKIVFAK